MLCGLHSARLQTAVWSRIENGEPSIAPQFAAALRDARQAPLLVNCADLFHGEAPACVQAQEKHIHW